MRTSAMSSMFLAAIVLASAAGSSRAEVFVDDFEGPSLDSFWYIGEEHGGIVTFPNLLQARSGKQSARTEKTSDSLDCGVDLRHTFPGPTYGTFSVFMYDSFAGNHNGNYTSLELAMAGAWAVTLGSVDWSGTNYWFNAGTPNATETTVPRTVGWHELVISDFPNQFTMSVDGHQVYSSNHGTAIDTIELRQNAPWWRPSNVFVAWDDFSADYQAVPEPSTTALLSLGALSLVALRRRNPARWIAHRTAQGCREK